ncbi:hypothetical protein KL86DYS2_12098 [uncultured Dysgonomonas sp.]|nr:hypothetical protein KL86DYS2_12098 [uncultured Dysgonomonas sp.]
MVWLSVLKDNKSKQEKQTRLVDYQVIKQKKVIGISSDHYCL